MALIFNKIIGVETRLGIWKIEESENELLKKLQLSDLEKEYLLSFQNEKRTKNWLGSRVLLRQMMNTEDYIWLDKDEFNKPILKNFPENISISHSNDLAAVLLSKSYPVGIDLEIIRTKVLLIKNRFLSKPELDFINLEHEINHLYACWCIKEAIYKWFGRKGISFRDEILIKPFTYKKEGFAEFTIHRKGFSGTRVANYFIFENYMIAWVESNIET